MINSLKSTISRNITNARGWRTNRKIVVIESDDWGSIRMASKNAYRNLLEKNYPVDKCPYNKNDSLESNDDLSQLFEVLKSVKGADNKPAIMTINNIVSNPDFEKIKESGFKKYFIEPFTETLKKYPKHDKVMTLYREGIHNKLILPQFHGREHLNVNRWMKALQNSEKAELDAFNNKVFSAKVAATKGYGNEYMDALDFDSIAELEDQKKYLVEGLNMFQEIWGFKSESFIAPCYIWHSELEKTLYKHGVRYIQGLLNQLQPEDKKGYIYKKIYHYQGQRNKLGQRYFVRNAFFEPTINPDFDWIDDCLNRISIAFRWKKPAIISSHRLNFIGHLNPKNREDNLVSFKELLTTITKKWPDVIFLSTNELGKLYDK